MRRPGNCFAANGRLGWSDTGDGVHQPGPLDSVCEPVLVWRQVVTDQDPAAAVLLPRRTNHLGVEHQPPHPASSPALALGNPIQSRPGPTASHSTPDYDGAVGDRATHRPYRYVPANSRHPGPRAVPSSVLCPHLAPRAHRRPPSAPPSERLQAARRPPAYPNQARDNGAACRCPSHPSAVLHAVQQLYESVDSGLRRRGSRQVQGRDCSCRLNDARSGPNSKSTAGRSSPKSDPSHSDG